MQASELLLIDDEALSLVLLENHLKATNYQTHAVTSGNIAWQLLQENPQRFAAVLSDRVMPGMSGLSLLKNMKADAGLKHIPFIMLTGLAEKDEMIEAYKAGIFDFLMKPVEQELLLLVVKRALAQK